MRLGRNPGRNADEAFRHRAGHGGGGCEIRTREGLPPTRFPSLWAIVHVRSARSVTWSCGLVRPFADAPEPQRMRPELRPAQPRVPDGFQEHPWFVCHCRFCLAFQYSGVARQARSSRVYPALGLATVPSTRRPSGGKPTRTLQGMARVRSGQAPAWPLSSGRSVRRGSRVKRDFACTLAGAFPPVLVVLREQSRLGLEGRTRTLSGPSPDLTSSVSGLLRDSADVRQARSRCLRCCPGVTLRAPGRPSHRARGGHNLTDP
jgi:hypothetical protein